MLAFVLNATTLMVGIVAGGVIGAGASRIAVTKAARAIRRRESDVERLSAPTLAQPLQLLPRSAGYFGDETDAPLGQAATLIGDLAELTLDQWLKLGTTVLEDRDEQVARDDARRILDSAIDEHRLGVPAWFVRDGVETAAFRARRRASRLSRADRGRIAAARDAAQSAALAILARAYLSQTSFDALCAPLAACAQTTTAPLDALVDRERGAVTTGPSSAAGLVTSRFVRQPDFRRHD